jgi:DNA modification methylase
MRLNDINGKVWIKLSKSVWITRKLLAWSEHVPLKISSSFVKQERYSRSKKMHYRPLNENLVKLIELFTQKGQRVFDPYLQYGDTLKATLSIEREFIGIGETLSQCSEIKEQLDFDFKSRKFQLFNTENNPSVLSDIQDNSIDFLLSEIPSFYFKDEVNNYQSYLHVFEKDLKKFINKLKPKTYVAIIVSDQRYRHRYYCRHADVINIFKKTDLVLQGLINIIEDSQALKAYGYPTSYVPNIINRFVVVARMM